MKKHKTIFLFISMLCMVSFLSINVLAAKDSNGKVTVKVLTSNHDEEYFKNLELDDGSKISDYDYTIEYVVDKTRDPVLITYYFSSVAWITRDGVVSLSLDPTQELRDSSTLRDSGWNVLTNVFQNEPDWPKDASKLQTFHWQYDCHWSFANDKDYWNLEPSRTASSYLAVVLAGCNP